MGAHSQSDKEKNHQRIVGIAAERFRELGVNGIGVDGLMKAAGLTHGGFYKHFQSRDDLVGEAVEHALSDGARGIADVESVKSKKPPLELLIDAYLSMAHRDNRASSCAVTTLSADVSRSNERARSAYTRQVEKYLELLKRLIGQNESETGRIKSIAALSSLVGALSIARAVNDKKLSREILKSAARELKDRLN